MQPMHWTNREFVGALGTLLLLATPSHAVTGVLCIKAVGKGAIKVRDTACKVSEVQIGTFDTDAPKVHLTAQCPADAVRVGEVCIDKYEATVWQTTDASTITSIQRGEIVNVAQLAFATQHGVIGDDYGAGCPDTGNSCTEYYAVSVPGVTPSTHLTWFQAAAACRNAGKRLATNQEWQLAALGTPDPGPDDGINDCAIISSLSATGSRSLCVSDTGAFDMVGNVWELVADWGEDATDCNVWTAGDISCVGGNGSSGLPAVTTRGGDFDDGWVGSSAGIFAVEQTLNPSASSATVGFRCARQP